MTWFALLEQMMGGVGGLRAALEAAIAANPDNAATYQEWINRLGGAVDEESLTALAAALPSEAMDILRGKLRPHDHPGDAI